MSSGTISLGNQRLYQYEGMKFIAGDSITGNSSWNVNDGNLTGPSNPPDQGRIGINSPGMYIISITGSGRYCSGMFSLYRIGGTLYCKALGILIGSTTEVLGIIVGRTNIIMFDSNNLRNAIFSQSINRVISTSDKFLIGIDTNAGGTQGISSIRVYKMCS